MSQEMHALEQFDYNLGLWVPTPGQGSAISG